jgi:hypothetical protein
LGHVLPNFYQQLAWAERLRHCSRHIPPPVPSFLLHAWVLTAMIGMDCNADRP